MKIAKQMFLFAVVFLAAPWAEATFTYCNNNPCKIILLTVCKIRIENYQYQGMTTEQHYVYPGQCPTFYDEGGNGQYLWIQKNYHGHTEINICGAVAQIVGLPEAVCTGTSYQLTALSDGNPLSQGVIWSGAGTVLSQSGSAATVQFPSGGSNLVMYAQAAQGQAAPAAQASTQAIELEMLQDTPQGLALVSSGQIVRISDAPTMPGLKARLKNAGSMPGTVDWKITIVFNRPSRNDSSTLTANGAAASATWDIGAAFGANFFGGTATLEATYKASSGASTQLCSPYTVHIRGTNPTVQTLETYIGSSPWYAIAISQQEHGSDGLQFNNIGTEGPNYNGTPAQIKNTPNRSSDQTGWGAFQLDTPAATITQVWSWRANVDGAKALMATHRTQATNWIQSQETQQMSQTPTQVLANESFSWGNDSAGNNVIFKKGTSKTPEDAVAIVLFNGANNGHAIWWDNPSATWRQRPYPYITAIVGRL